MAHTGTWLIPHESIAFGRILWSFPQYRVSMEMEEIIGLIRMVVVNRVWIGVSPLGKAQTSREYLQPLLIPQCIDSPK